MASEFRKLLGKNLKAAERFHQEFDQVKHHTSYVSISTSMFVDPEKYAKQLSDDGTLVGPYYAVEGQKILGWVPTIYIPFLCATPYVIDVNYSPIPPTTAPPKILLNAGKVMRISKKKQSL